MTDLYLVLFDRFFSSSLCVIFSCFLASVINFYWIPDIVNFTSLGAGYFCIVLNILELYSGNSLIPLRLAFKLCLGGLNTPLV